MFRRLFLDHPASVGETYFEHFGVATGFGAKMIVGGLGAVIHGVLPFAFKTTGSTTSPRSTPGWSASAPRLATPKPS